MNCGKSDIILEGDDNTQRDLRLMLYHLYSFAREGTSYSLSPMGLSGLGYNGHTFWDTEIWMFPGPAPAATENSRVAHGISALPTSAALPG